MLLAIGVFLVVTGIAMGLGWALSAIPGNMAKRRLEKRLREVGSLSIMQDGESNWVEGVQLLAVYLILALAFFWLPL